MCLWPRPCSSPQCVCSLEDEQKLYLKDERREMLLVEAFERVLVDAPFLQRHDRRSGLVRLSFVVQIDDYASFTEHRVVDLRPEQIDPARDALERSAVVLCVGGGDHMVLPGRH